MTTLTYTKTGSKSTAKAALDKAVFGAEVENTQMLKEVYMADKANARTNTAHTKTRGEIRGGGRKPWRQKGTGRARAGSIRSPIWRGGGIIFGPRSKNNHAKKTSAKARRQSLVQALSLANSGGRLSVIEAWPSLQKTSEVKKLLDKIGFEHGLIVAEKADSPIKRLTANIPGVVFTVADKLSAADVMDAAHVLAEKSAIGRLTERLKG